MNLLYFRKKLCKFYFFIFLPFSESLNENYVTIRFIYQKNFRYEQGKTQMVE